MRPKPALSIQQSRLTHREARQYTKIQYIGRQCTSKNQYLYMSASLRRLFLFFSYTNSASDVPERVLMKSASRLTQAIRQKSLLPMLIVIDYWEYQGEALTIDSDFDGLALCFRHNGALCTCGCGTSARWRWLTKALCGGDRQRSLDKLRGHTIGFHVRLVFHCDMTKHRDGYKLLHTSVSCHVLARSFTD